MTVSREEFERNLAESRLLSEDALRALLEAVPDAVADVDALARHLVSHGHLTAFQAEAVRQRRFELLCVGNYVVLESLGAGGMGTVYKARHRKMKRAVALKILRHDGAGHSFARRFEREIETIAQLSHPNIVMAFDAAEAEVGSFLVMEYVDGRDLGAEVKHGGPLSVAEAVEATIDAARGLDYAHSRGFVHRDVKPANLLRDSHGRTKVADLGLARLEAPEIDSDAASASAVTQVGSVLGTADYMAPEQ
ncbi:MAG TPA: serine/threonine-protein kinase, partial [Isosphaeraceae bacterium]